MLLSFFWTPFLVLSFLCMARFVCISSSSSSSSRIPLVFNVYNKNCSAPVINEWSVHTHDLCFCNRCFVHATTDFDSGKL